MTGVIFTLANQMAHLNLPDQSVGLKLRLPIRLLYSHCHDLLDSFKQRLTLDRQISLINPEDFFITFLFSKEMARNFFSPTAFVRSLSLLSNLVKVRKVPSCVVTGTAIYYAEQLERIYSGPTAAVRFPIVDQSQEGKSERGPPHQVKNPELFMTCLLGPHRHTNAHTNTHRTQPGQKNWREES